MTLEIIYQKLLFGNYIVLPLIWYTQLAADYFQKTVTPFLIFCSTASWETYKTQLKDEVKSPDLLHVTAHRLTCYYGTFISLKPVKPSSPRSQEPPIPLFLSFSLPWANNLSWIRPLTFLHRYQSHFSPPQIWITNKIQLHSERLFSAKTPFEDVNFYFGAKNTLCVWKLSCLGLWVCLVFFSLPPTPAGLIIGVTSACTNGFALQSC